MKPLKLNELYYKQKVPQNYLCHVFNQLTANIGAFAIIAASVSTTSVADSVNC